jgi:hypothetical protein
MVMKMPPVTISLSGRVPGDCSRTPRDGFDDDGCGGTFLENWLGYLGFSRSGEYIGARATSVGTRGGPTMPRRGQGGPRLGVVRPPRCPSSGALRSSCCPRTSKVLGFCPVRFREYFPCRISETKNSRKQQLALRHLVNRLVPENA